MNAVGIDVSKGKSMVAALRPMGEVALLPQEFLHTEVGLEQMAYAIIALVILLMCLILYLFLSQGERIIRKIGNSGSIVINKMVAFFTFCVGVQIVVTGIAKLFNLHV